MKHSTSPKNQSAKHPDSGCLGINRVVIGSTLSKWSHSGPEAFCAGHSEDSKPETGHEKPLAPRVGEGFLQKIPSVWEVWIFSGTSQLEFNTYLRSWKHVRCFYRVIEAQVEVWENKKCCGKCLHSFFEFSQTFTSIEIWRTCFLFHLENTVPKRENSKQLLPFDYQNVNSLSSCHHYINSSW